MMHWMITGCSESGFTECCFIDDEDPPGMDDDTLDMGPVCWDMPIQVRRDQEMNQLFTKNGPGWTGADGTLSVELNDGRSLWIFGDTFLGIVNQDRSRTSFAFVNNTVLLQVGNDLTNPVQGPRAFASPPESDWWYWPGHGHVHGDTLELIMYAMVQSEPGMWGFDYAAIDLLKYTLPDLQWVSNERKVNFPTINFGTSILKEGEYIYVYGAEKQGLNKYLHVARCKGGSLSNDWEYFDGEDWVSDMAKSRRQAPNVSEQFSVFQDGNQYYLLTQHHVLGEEIYMYRSDKVHTGFTQRKLIYCTPETHGDIFTYNAFAHPQFSDEDGLLISYNVNSFNFNDVLKNADNYRPWFFRVEGWK
mgnify:FL=1